MFSSDQFVAAIFVLTWSVACLILDLSDRKLPNWLTLGASLIALLVLAITGKSLMGAALSSAMLAWVLALALTLPAYITKWLGAGDVKMLAAIGLLTGLNFTLFSYAIAGLLALGLIIGGLIWRRTQPWLNLKLARIHYQLPAISPSSGRQMPFGALLAVGLIISLVMLQTGLLRV